MSSTKHDGVCQRPDHAGPVGFCPMHAAAPLMLEALKRLDGYTFTKEDDQMRRAAIAAATGEQP